MDRILLYYYAISNKYNTVVLPPVSKTARLLNMSQQSVRNKIDNLTRQKILFPTDIKNVYRLLLPTPFEIPKEDLLKLLLYYNENVLNIYLLLLEKYHKINRSFDFTIEFINEKKLFSEKFLIETLEILQNNNFLNISKTDTLYTCSFSEEKMNEN